MSIFKKSWWHHHIRKWQAVSNILGITDAIGDEEKSLGQSAKYSYDHQAGQYEDGQKDDQSDSQNALRIAANALTAASNAESDGDGEEE